MKRLLAYRHRVCNLRFRQLFPVLLGALALISLSTTASASPVGNLQIDTCGGVNVTATAITFLGTPGGKGQSGYGCINSSAGGVGTNITYSGGTLGAGVNGEIKSLTFGVTAGTDFMDFTGVPNLIFDLAGFNPGPSNTNCATLTLNSSCSAAAGSPFILELVQGGTGTCPVGISGNCETSVGLSIQPSILHDLGNGTSALYSGLFSTTISTMSPAQIQATILTPGGTVGSGGTGSFTATAIPEPSSMLLIGMGLIGLAASRKRK